MDWKITLPTSTGTNECPKNAEVSDTAEERFREAFNRLKCGLPRVLPKGTPVSQNNVAKEAKRDPSALRKSRFPLLVIEIQEWLEAHKDERQDSIRQKTRNIRKRNRNFRETIADLKLQRDTVAGLLADANLRIVELMDEVGEVRAHLDAIRPPTIV